MLAKTKSEPEGKKKTEVGAFKYSSSSFPLEKCNKIL